MDILLNFVNESHDANNSEIVIFQQNVAANFDEYVVAWKVIQSSGHGHNHPFVYPEPFAVAANDVYGSFTPRLAAVPGELFSATPATSGNSLVSVGRGSNPAQLQVRNDLKEGAIGASIYKANSLLATKPSIAPGQMAVFQFKPTIWIGVASQIL